MKSPAFSPRSVWLAKILALAAADYVTGSLSMLLANPPGSAPIVWPPAGIALAGLLLFGYRVWPGIWLGSFLTHNATFFNGSSLETALRSLAAAAGNGLGDVLQAVAGGWLVLRLLGKTPPLASLKEVLVLTAFAGLIGSMLGSTVAAAIAVASAIDPFWTTWWAWWRANGVGVLVFAPLVLTLAEARSRALTPLQVRTLVEAAVILVGFSIYTFFLTEKLGDLLSAGLVALFLLWATLRFSTLGTALGMLMIALVLIWNVNRGDVLLGAINAGAAWRVLTAQTILWFLGLTFWVLAAIQQDRQRIMSELRTADRLKDEFLAMLAHELRNPLAPLRNALHIMKQPGTQAAVIGQCREMAERQVQHMARLLDDLLDVSRVSQGKIELRKESVDLAAVLQGTVGAVRPLMEERGHQFTVALPSGPLWVQGDPVRLDQVLTNLLNNAAKYTEPGGQIWLRASREGDKIVLRVRDTGLGIAADMLPRIFDLFVQAKRQFDRSKGGIGIGLTLVRKLVELHSGSIEACSAGLGRGSEFIVRLPALAAEPRPRHTRAEGGRPTLP
jgi:signal transduction histidine kinase